MQVEHAITIAARPLTLSGIYADVARWPTWDPDTREASIDGPFAVGTRGRLKPTRGNTVPMLLTQVDAQRGFTVESRIPLFRMCFEHELEPEGDHTRVTHRVRFAGLLSWVLGPMLIRQLNQGLPVTLARLKALAESRESQQRRLASGAL